jgi:hypothetical protein
MVALYNIKNPPKRKIPKGRVSRKHHYVLTFPTDFKFGNPKLSGKPYIGFFDSFLEDCVKRMYKYAPELHEYGEFDIMTACLN